MAKPAGFSNPSGAGFVKRGSAVTCGATPVGDDDFATRGKVDAVILLVRHPPTDIAPGTCYGRLDPGLADPAAAAALAAALRHVGGTVWTSPARRCRAVAELLAPCRVDERLLELHFGAWEGWRWDDVSRGALDRWAADPWEFAPPGGESGSALVARITDFRDAIRTGDHVVISHGGPLKVLGNLLRSEPVDLLGAAPALGSVTRFE